MTVGQIFTKIGNFIENRQVFMLLNCNCANVATFEHFQTCLGAFFRGRSVDLGPSHIVSDGAQLALGKGAQQPPRLFGPCLCGQTVAYLSYC